MEKLLMLGSNHNSADIVLCAKSMGVHTVAADYYPPERSAAKRAADEHWLISTGDLDALERKCREEGVTAVASGVSDFNTEQAVQLSARLGLPSYCTPAAWHYARDKADFKALCRQMGVPVAEDWVLSDPPTREELDAVRLPVVVKPVDRSSNRGMSYCWKRGSLEEACRHARSLSDQSRLIVERMIEGHEYTAYYVLAEGEARLFAFSSMSSQPGAPGNCYSLTTTVADLKEQYIRELDPAVRTLIKAAGCTDGYVWFEMMAEHGRFYFLEMGYRLPGDVLQIPLRSLTGFDVIRWMTECALGRRHRPEQLAALPDPLASKRSATSYLLWTSRAGTIGEISGVEQIAALPCVERVDLAPVGTEFDAHRPIGPVLFTSDDCGQLCDTLERINRTIRVTDQEGEDMLIRFTNYERLEQMARAEESRLGPRA